MKEDIYPCTIICDRYGGSYSGGKWTAWRMDFDAIPSAIDYGDMECMYFWDNESEVYFIGKGNTPQEAYNDLARKLKDKNE